MLSTRSHKDILSIINWLIFVRDQSKFCFASQSLILKLYLKAYMPLIVKDWYSVTWKLLWDKSLFMTLWDLLVLYCAMKFDYFLEYFPFSFFFFFSSNSKSWINKSSNFLLKQFRWPPYISSVQLISVGFVFWKLASCTWVLRIWITVILKTAQYKRID